MFTFGLRSIYVEYRTRIYGTEQHEAGSREAKHGG
jgi:hypothetical protein